MIVQKQNIFTGKVNEMDLPVTEQQLNEWINGKLVQKVFPFLTPTQREFLITGMSEKEQKFFYGE